MVSSLCNYVMISHGGYMMNNKILIGIVAIFVVSIISLGAIAYQGNSDVKGPKYNEDVHEELEAAMDAGDYDLWLSIREENNLPTRGRIFQVITADNFSRYVALHEANEAGDEDTASSIRSELGLGQGMMKKGQGKGHKSLAAMQGKGKAGTLQYEDADADGMCDNYQLR